MKFTRITTRYGKALMKVSEGDLSKADQYLAPLEALASLFEHKAIKKVLKSPVTSKELKWEVFEKVLSSTNSDRSLNLFVKNIVFAGRTVILEELYSVFKNLLSAKKGILAAHVVSCDGLDSDQEKDIVSELERATGKQIELSTSTNPQLLGGFVIKLGNKLIDLSLKSKLDNLVNNALL